MKIINYIYGKMVESMLKDENFIPIYMGEELLEFAYRNYKNS